jgi:putative DNA primase/helicase
MRKANRDGEGRPKARASLMASEPIRIDVSDPLTTAWLDTSDWGNAKRLVTIAGGKLLWIDEAQAWAFYDGRRWALERGNTEAQRMAHRVIEHIDLEAEALGEIAEDIVQLASGSAPGAHGDRAETGRDAARPCGAVRQRRDDGGDAEAGAIVPVGSLDDFDRDPLVYNVPERHAALQAGQGSLAGQEGRSRSRRPADAARQCRV